MRETELEGLEKFAEGLSLFFYIFMFMATVVALAGSVGSAFLLLLLGSCAHVGQAGLGEFVAAERARAQRPEPVSRRLDSRAAREPAETRTRSARRAVA